jgi:outer membrane protein TolC
MSRCALPRARHLALAAGALVLLHAALAAGQQPEVVVPNPLSLREAVDIALRSSNALGIEQAQLFALRKQRTAAWFNLGPDLQASAGYNRTTRTDLDLPQITSAGDTILVHSTEETTGRRYSGSSAIRLFDGFANYNRIAASGHDVDAQEHTVEYVRQQVTELVVQTYFDLLRAKLLANVAVESEKVAKDQLDRTSALYDLGSAARSDVLKQQVQHDQTRLDLVKANQLERQAHVDLEWAMNLESPAPFDIDTTVTRYGRKTTDFETERDFALLHRQNLLSFRAQEQASGNRVWEARGVLLPTLDFQYTFDRAENPSQFRLGASNTHIRGWGFFANWNIWDRYQNYANLGRAKADRRIAEYQRQQAELDAIREIRRLVNTMDEALERLEVSRQNVESAREDLRLAQEKFRVGAGTVLDVTTAETGLTRARANEVQAVVDYLIARAQLARATGRPLTEV